MIKYVNLGLKTTSADYYRIKMYVLGRSVKGKGIRDEKIS